MHIATLTFDSFNELASLIALGVLNRVKIPGWRVSLAGPSPTVTSMNGVTLHTHCDLAEACAADTVLVGSGIKTREIAAGPTLMAQLRLDPTRQLVGAVPGCKGRRPLGTHCTMWRRWGRRSAMWSGRWATSDPICSGLLSTRSFSGADSLSLGRRLSWPFAHQPTRQRQALLHQGL